MCVLFDFMHDKMGKLFVALSCYSLEANYYVSANYEYLNRSEVIGGAAYILFKVFVAL